MLTEGINRSLLFSPGFVARRVRRPWIRGARRSVSRGVLGHYVEHGGGALWAAQQSRRGLARCGGKLGRKAVYKPYILCYAIPFIACRYRLGA
jgi:hypothetical protein